MDGYEQVMQKWPFFRAAESRDPMKYMLPVPVRSCWGGMGKQAEILVKNLDGGSANARRFSIHGHGGNLFLPANSVSRDT